MSEPALHEKGYKGERDREHVVQKYFEFFRFFRVKPIKDSDLAVMGNQQIYHMTEDLYNRQPSRKRIAYAQSLGLMRENDLSFKWFWRDTVAIYRPNIIGKIVLVVRSPWLYADYRKRKQASIDKKKAEAGIAKAAMSKAASPAGKVVPLT